MKYSFFVTDDNSPSLRNLEVDEPYHSKAGAYLEAKVKYVDALDVKANNGAVILDVCFGLGYNTAAAIDRLIERKETATFICFENDLGVLKQLHKLEYDSKGFNLMKKAVANFLDQKNIDDSSSEVLIQGFKFVFEIGDARKLIKKYVLYADFVFFDPFSPKKQPEMWEKQFLKDVYNSMKEGSSLATYSYARVVRENLQDSGFEISDGPVLGRRSPSTIAIKKTL